MIKCILFDIGGVFLHPSEDALRDVAGSHGIAAADLDAVLHGPLWDRYKRGRMDERQYWSEVSSQLPDAFDGRTDELRRRLDDTVLLDSELVSIARRLKNSYRIAALSNAGAELERRLNQFAIDDLFEVVVNSHRLKMAKPDVAIYLYTADILALPPDNVLFVDDKDRNTVVAAQLGFSTHTFMGAGRFGLFAQRTDLIATSP